MSICYDCGDSNVQRPPRKNLKLCPHEYEDIIAGLKQRLKNCIRPEEYQAMLNSCQERNATINRRNQQIKDLKHRIAELGEK